jgi:Fe-S-cluster containining protein
MTTEAEQTVYFCTGCGNCCRWPGYVHVTNTEVIAIADYVGLSVDDFADKYTRLTMNRRGLSLTEESDGSCTFLSGDRCTINDVKPRQCRDFPTHWSFPNFEAECPALPLKVRITELAETAL